MDQWTNGTMDQWTNGPMVQWTNSRPSSLQELLSELIRRIEDVRVWVQNIFEKAGSDKANSLLVCWVLRLIDQLSFFVQRENNGPNVFKETLWKLVPWYHWNRTLLSSFVTLSLCHLGHINSSVVLCQPSHLKEHEKWPTSQKQVFSKPRYGQLQLFNTSNAQKIRI